MCSDCSQPCLRQSWIVVSVLIIMISGSCGFAFSTVFKAGLREPNSSFKMDLNKVSWFTSSFGTGTMIGCLVASVSVEVLGRRLTHVFLALAALLGWLTIYLASDFTTLIVGRLLTGSSCAVLSIGSIIIGEYTTPEYRGVFLVLKTVGVSISTLGTHFLGNYFSWRTIALVLAIPNGVALLMTLTWPESPYWLAARNKFDKCERAFVWLRGDDDKSMRELKELVREQQNRRDNTRNRKHWLVTLLKKYQRKEFWMSMLILLLAGVLMEATGRHFFPAFATDIVTEVIGDKTQAVYYVLGIDLVFAISTAFSCILIKLIRRRTLIFTTGAVSLGLLYLFCGYRYLVSIELISRQRQWIPMCFIVGYFIFINLSCTMLPLLLMGEIMPLAHKGVGSAVAGTAYGIFVQLTLYVVPFGLAGIKVHGTFAVAGLIMLVILIILYFIMPETKDKTLCEIENYLRHGQYEVRDCLEDEEMVDKRAKETDTQPTVAALTEQRAPLVTADVRDNL